MQLKHSLIVPFYTYKNKNTFSACTLMCRSLLVQLLELLNLVRIILKYLHSLGNF